MIEMTDSAFLFLLGVFFVGPFLTPLLTSVIVGLVLRMEASALRWGLLFGVLAIPGVGLLSWFWEDWPGWFAGLGASAAVTALFLWWRSWASARRRGA